MIYLNGLVTQRNAENHQKNFFKKNVEILLKTTDVRDSFKSYLFSIISDTTPSETSINEESFMNEINNQQKGKLTLKKMLQRLQIALVQVKTGSNSENLLNEIRNIVYSLYQSKEITKKVYNNIIKSIKV